MRLPLIYFASARVAYDTGAQLSPSAWLAIGPMLVGRVAAIACLASVP